MADQHPVTPPPELRRLWAQQAQHTIPCHDPLEWMQYVSEKAAQWGYEQRGEVNEAKLQEVRDQELEACCKWLDYNCPSIGAHHLRNDRRPKSPTQAEKALEQYDRCVSILEEKGYSPAGCIRDALVCLKQLEELFND